MAPTALVTINLEGWPPPLIEVHALIAALPKRHADSSDAPPNACQQVNELVVAFPFASVARLPNEKYAGQVAEQALASIYDGCFDIQRVRIT
jgi:hypothetical protein